MVQLNILITIHLSTFKIKIMKKKMLLFAYLFLCLLYVQAQDFKYKLANSKEAKVSLELDADDIRIEGYNGDELLIKGGSNEPIPEQAKGLKPLYNSNVDNTGIGLAVNMEGGVLKIEKASRKSAKYTIRVPNKVSILFVQTNWQGSSITISNVESDLEVKTNNADIKLNNITGPVVASSISGNFTAVFGNLNQSKPCAVSLVSGEIDVTLPTSAKTTLQMKSVTGEIYSDLDLNLKGGKDSMPKVGGGHQVEGHLNGGGVSLKLNTVSSNIYVRKQK